MLKPQLLDYADNPRFFVKRIQKTGYALPQNSLV